MDFYDHHNEYELMIFYKKKNIDKSEYHLSKKFLMILTALNRPLSIQAMTDIMMKY